MQFNAGVIIKLLIWSFLVGLLLYWLEWSPGDVYGWIANKVATLWDWLVGSGLQYVLLGATIVVPIYFIMQFKNRRRGG
ncbi:DUF6460 domain-containing protein [Kordiimonas lipolytica]|uniref:DUF6460 domain-containing protein n=1 Tax=Kordiimonas lipolytica TaxID=1662421 RepID=A0ABV8U6F7_9PROT|nr:DUF6460 domain-containing protein [Kordiimonas lipolytica]